MSGVQDERRDELEREVEELSLRLAALEGYVGELAGWAERVYVHQTARAADAGAASGRRASSEPASRAQRSATARAGAPHLGDQGRFVLGEPRAGGVPRPRAAPPPSTSKSCLAVAY